VLASTDADSGGETPEAATILREANSLLSMVVAATDGDGSGS
jgi:hypothetical protein